MATQTTGLTNFGANVLPPAYLEARFLSQLRPNLTLLPLGKPSTLPEGAGKVVRWQYFNPETGLAALTTSITEGGDPAHQSQTTTTLSATLAEYSSYTDYTKFLDAVAIPATIPEMADNLGFKASVSIDAIIHLELANTTSSVDTGVAWTAEGIRKAEAILAGQNAKPHRNTPGGKFFAAVLHSDQCYDMLGEGSPSWVQIKRDEYLRSMVGGPFDDALATSAIYNTIVKMSNNTQVSASNNVGFLIADESFGVASLRSNLTRPRLINITPEENVAAVAKNRGSLAYWFLFATKLFSSNRVCQLLADQ